MNLLLLNKKRNVCYFICNLFETNIIIINIENKIYYNVSNDYEKSIILLDGDDYCLSITYRKTF